MAEPSYFFSYVLQFDDDGTYYVGSTNAPFARWTEHAIGNGTGAKATEGRSFVVRMAAPFFSRREAEYNEGRLQRALERDPHSLEALVQVFDQMVNVVRPQKTLAELVADEKAYEREMRRSFHHTKIGPFGGRKATCGYDKGEIFGTTDWETLLQMERERMALESVGGKYRDRKACQRCLRHAPARTDP